jgi:peroxiredoxin family protein
MDLAVEEAVAQRGAEASAAEQPLSIVLFSGTDDRLTSAAILATGAVVLGRPVHIFLQYWGVEAFRRDLVEHEHGLSAEADPPAVEAIRRQRLRPGWQHWSDMLRTAKELGELDIRACALSTDTFGLTLADLDPMVDGVEGVASFMSKATGQVVFI